MTRCKAVCYAFGGRNLNSRGDGEGMRNNPLGVRMSANMGRHYFRQTQIPGVDRYICVLCGSPVSSAVHANVSTVFASLAYKYRRSSSRASG